MKASSPEEKTRAFEKVVELNPDHAEGYYYLGMAYKSRQMYPEAEVALNRAYFKNSLALNKNIRTQILYALGGVYEIRGKLEQAEDALRGAKGLTSDNDKIRGQICFRLGQMFAKQDKIDAALAEFSEGKRILPQESARFSQAIDEMQSKKDLSDRYLRAVSLLNAEQYTKALEQFNMIIRLQSDFKDVQSKAAEAQKRLDEKIALQETTRLYDDAMTKAEKGQPEEAIHLLQQVVARDSNFKDAEFKLRNFQDQSRTEPVPVPEKPDVAGKEPARKNNELEDLYEKGLRSFRNNNFANALTTFQTLAIKQPGYKNVDALLLEIESALSAGPVSKTDSLFEAGQIALQNSEWLDAILAFEKVKLLDPGYPDIENKLADARFHFEKGNASPKPEKVARHNGMSVSQILTSFLALPLALAIMLISPGARARLYLMRGDYVRAAAIYERLLLKNPGRLKLYSILANIYLLENRRDQNAMKIFETIIKMNLHSKKKQEINTIVAHHYLTEGRQDATAIAVMERELDSRFQNLNGE